MKLETIIKAYVSAMQRGKLAPHCDDYKGSVDDIEWHEGYSEPGYEAGKKGVLTANWNSFPTKLVDVLEKSGYEIEWSDEWASCENCYKLVRTSPDSYGWERSYVVYNECEITCSDCVNDDLGQYEEHLLNKATQADTFGIDWESRGFTKCFHPGQNDDPKEIVKHIPKDHDFLFAIPSVGQFDVYFDCYIKRKGGE